MSKSNATLPYELPSHKIRVGLLGATGVVGQQFIRILSSHPWFELYVLGASERSAGQQYNKACTWKLTTDLPTHIATKQVVTCEPQYFNECKCIFSALDSNVAGDIESKFAQSGFPVFSNARNHRYDNTVPILVPYANSAHINSVHIQRKQLNYTGNGFIVTNANCSSTGLVIALQPLLQKYGLQSVFVVTLQAISGAGYPGVASLDILDNIYPYISGEEEKMGIEPLKILGSIDSNQTNIFKNADFKVSAMCNRVPVIDGHTECVSLQFNQQPTSIQDIIDTLNNYTSEAQTLQLPSASPKPILVHTTDNRPQPRLDRDIDNGMTVAVGRIRKCNLFDYKFNLVSHNTVIGAAGGSVLNAELAYAKGLIKQ